MSELENIVEIVQSISNSLNQTLSGAAVYRKNIAEYSATLIKQTEGTKQREILECLVAFQMVCKSLGDFQISLRQTIDIANEWIAKMSGSGSNPTSGHSMSLGSFCDEEESYSRRR